MVFADHSRVRPRENKTPKLLRDTVTPEQDDPRPYVPPRIAVSSHAESAIGHRFRATVLCRFGEVLLSLRDQARPRACYLGGM
jgi:hypothetical protein